ncbi:hypothetical protein [Sphingobium sp.]|uniref:hypothetical protein n=1 Tax=Sphingobium sp. TaxID=1912891 RepID=UPI003B3BB7AE
MRFEWGMVTAVTGGMFAVLGNFDLSVRYWPPALLPAAMMFVFLRSQTWRDRRAGKRFSSYRDDEMSG